MRCRNVTPKNLLGLNCCLLLILGIFFLYRNERLSKSGYRNLALQASYTTNENVLSDSKAGLADKLQANVKHFIPKILHQVFSTERVYENYKPYINGCLSLNPDWEYYLWTDADAEKLILDKYPKLLPKYKKYTDNLEKSDFIRYLLLHHMGVAAARGKSFNSLSLQQKGCVLLESKQWRSDERDSSTIGVHKFLHLGYDWIGGRDRKPLFSVPKAFPGRVKFYGGRNSSYTLYVRRVDMKMSRSL